MEELRSAARFAVLALAALAVVMLLPTALLPWLAQAHYAEFDELQPQQLWALLVPGLLVLATAIGLLLVVRRHVSMLNWRLLLLATLIALSMSYAAFANLRADLHRLALLAVQRDFFASLSALHGMGLADFRHTPPAACAAARERVDAHAVRLPEEAAWKSGLELRLLTAGCTASDDYPRRLAELAELARSRAANAPALLPDPGVLEHVLLQLDPAQSRHQEAMRLSREARDRGSFAAPPAAAMETAARQPGL